MDDKIKLTGEQIDQAYQEGVGALVRKETNDKIERLFPRTEFISDEERAKVLADHEVESRREYVLRLRSRGKSAAQIAETLGASLSTVKHDLKELRDRQKEYYGNCFDKDLFVTDSLGVFLEVENRANDLYDELPDGSPVKLSCLREIRTARKDSVELLQQSGFLDKQVDKKAILNINLNDVGWTTEDVERVSKLLMDAESKATDEQFIEGGDQG